MSARAETFYAIACDFPECGELYDGGDYTYSTDPGWQSDAARDDGWLIDAGPDGALDFCPTHTVEGECPPDGLVQGEDGSYCQWCEDNGTDTHLLPMPDTYENLLAIVGRRMVDDVAEGLRTVNRGMHADIERLSGRLDRNLAEIFDGRCRALVANINAGDLYDLRAGRPRRSLVTALAEGGADRG